MKDDNEGGVQNDPMISGGGVDEDGTVHQDTWFKCLSLPKFMLKFNCYYNGKDGIIKMGTWKDFQATRALLSLVEFMLLEKKKFGSIFPLYHSPFFHVMMQQEDLPQMLAT